MKIYQEVNFYRSLTISGSQSSTETTNIIDQSGINLEILKEIQRQKKFPIDQKIFQGFQGYNNLKKSRIRITKKQKMNINK